MRDWRRQGIPELTKSGILALRNYYQWYSDQDEGVKVPISKGRRLIVVHAGFEKGFINNGLLIFKSGELSGDYHDDMNHENFMQWVSKQLKTNLPPNVVVVCDNASYHNVRVEPNIHNYSIKKS